MPAALSKQVQGTPRATSISPVPLGKTPSLRFSACIRSGVSDSRLAKNFLGGKIFDTANWAEAKRYMEESVAAEPDRIVHHVDLAGVYRDTGDKAKAKAEWQVAMRLPNRDYNDRHYKAEADAGLRAD